MYAEVEIQIPNFKLEMLRRDAPSSSALARSIKISIRFNKRIPYQSPKRTSPTSKFLRAIINLFKSHTQPDVYLLIHAIGAANKDPCLTREFKRVTKTYASLHAIGLARSNEELQNEKRLEKADQLREIYVINHEGL